MASSSQTSNLSRLDRVFTLLENGASPVTRKAAAKQLGDVQKKHPHELNNLLAKLLVYIRHVEWDARIAAAEAIEAVISQVPPWDPEPTVKQEPTCPTTGSSDGGRLTFAHFDVDRVLNGSQLLLGSSGDEYQVPIDTEGLDAKARVKKQRKLLEKRLGLTLGGDATVGVTSDELFHDDDLISVVPDIKIKKETAKDEKQNCANVMAQLTEGMSSRERNRAKRKAKLIMKQQSREGTKQQDGKGKDGQPARKRKKEEASTQSDPNHISLDDVPKHSPSSQDWTEWPFNWICDELINLLFNSSWESRHGACLALREIIKKQGGGSGMEKGMTKMELIGANQSWLADLSIRLLCVVSLDRFADFVSDQVVAPVRESCAQTLSVVVTLMEEQSVFNVLQTLLHLHTKTEWEIRQSAMLALQYIIAVRQDLLSNILPLCFPHIMQGLHDKDGDVRSVSAKALMPTTQLLTQDKKYERELQTLLSVLWSSLHEYDELTSSTQSILILLSKLIKLLPFDTICQADRPEKLAARLLPFFHHALKSVRDASLSTMLTMLHDESNQILPWLLSICIDGLWNILQCCLLEANSSTRSLASEVFLLFVQKCPSDSLVPCTYHVPGWLNLVCQPALVPYDCSLLIGQHAPKTNAQHDNDDQQRVIGGLSTNTRSSSEFDEYIMRTREFVGRMIGALCCRSFHKLPPEVSTESPVNVVKQHLLHFMTSQSSLQRIVAAIVISSWWEDTSDLPHSISSELHSAVQTVQTESFYFNEITVKFVQVQTDMKCLINALQQNGVHSEYLRAKPIYSFEEVTDFCSSHFPKLVSPSNKGLIEQNGFLLKLAEESQKTQAMLDCRVKSYIACMIVSAAHSSKNINEVWKLPQKLNPIIRPLMESIKIEENATVRHTVSSALSRLIGLCAKRDPCPNGKLIKNLCSFLSSYNTRCPTSINTELEFSDETLKTCCLSRDHVVYDGVLTQLRRSEASLTEINKRKKKNNSKSGECDQTTTATSCIGAESCMQTICEMYASNLFVVVPQLWDIVSNLQDKLCNGAIDTSKESAMKILQSLVTFEAIVPAIRDLALQQKILTLLPHIIALLWNKMSNIRFLCARSIAALANHMTDAVMPIVIEQVLCNLNVSDDVYRQKGAIETIANIIKAMGTSVVAYAVFLIVPLLGCMSDHDSQIRLLSTHCFAQLIQFMPIESSIPNPPNMPESLISRKKEERRFLEQLFDSQSLEAYRVPVPIKAELRSYQEEGVKWLAFLNRYKLHGVLCDEMGLGKTLQTICIMASDHHYKIKKRQEEKPLEKLHLISLVICPPTLTGHWVEEVRRFCDDLNPLQYAGSPQERARLQSQVINHNLVVASYEVVRNDIAFFNKFKWNYCVLDEGHAIRNGKSKTSLSVKSLHSSHRLILTGTPIQNSVLELWSLFDFLIPGFLGSEQEFNVRFTKPIVTSRDAKSSSKEQEEGVLAMESLHRQVLPFMLRRMKEDVLKDLPPKIIQDYYCDLSPLQLELYEDFAKSRAKKNAESSIAHVDDDTDQKSRHKGTSHVFQALQYLQKVCNHPLFVVTQSHPQWQQILSQLKSSNSSLHDIKHATKLMALKQLLLDCGIGVTSDPTSAEQAVVNQHRALIFCQHRNLLDIIQKDLLTALMPSVTYLRLDGGIPANQRFSIVSRFNNDPSIDVLLLTTKVGGLGLNLTGADTVIFVEHDWNPMVDLQAMDRAHRIGQKKVVNVYRLITRGTMEEKILGLQKFKLNVANTVVGDDNRGLQSMGTSQVLELFTVDKDTGAKSKQSNDSSSRGLRAMMEDLGDLWDQNQYDDEYNLDNFIQNLSNK